VSNDPNYKATFVILDDFEAHGLVQFNKEYHDEEFFQNFIEFEKAFSNSIYELVSKLDTFQTNHDEMAVFLIFSELSYIDSHLEVIKKFLKIIINPTKLKGGFDENTTLNQMITKICNKMQYSEKLKNSIRGLFLVDFRNAIVSQQYLIYKNGDLVIYPKDTKMKKYLNIKDLTDNALQVMAILDAMLDWANGKGKSEDKKTEALDKVVKDLTKQVEALDKKLDRLS
jgi:hypothetical protein